MSIKAKDGTEETRDYANLYTLFPCKPTDWLTEAGLTAENGLLAVDP